jgi:copper chaperone CopZ
MNYYRKNNIFVPQINHSHKIKKIMKKIIVIVTLALFCFTAMAQQCGGAAKAKCNEGPKLEVKGAEIIVIQTNAYSAKSDDIFKNNLPFVKGVKDYKFDEATSKLAVAYDKKKTNPDAIRAAIAKLGFDADQVKGNEQARTKLPRECTTKPKGCAKSCGKH